MRADDDSWRRFYTALNTARGYVLRDQRIGFRNQEPEGILSFEIIDPVPVHVVDGGLQAR